MATCFNSRRHASTRKWLAVIVWLVACAALPGADWKTLEQAAETHFQQQHWLEAETAYSELLSQVESQATSNADAKRMQFRCRHQLEQLARLTGRPADGLRFALQIQQSLPANSDAEARWQNALHIAEYHIALANDSAARAQLQEMLSGRLGELKPVPRLSANYFLGLVEFRSGNIDAAKQAWNESENEIQRLLAQHQATPFLPRSEVIELRVRRVAIREALNPHESDQTSLEELFAKPNGSRAAAESAQLSAVRFQILLSLARHARWRRDSRSVLRHVISALRDADQIPLRQQAVALALGATALDEHDTPKAHELWQRLARSLAAEIAQNSSRTVSVTDLRTITEAWLKAQQPRDALHSAEQWRAIATRTAGESHRQTIAAVITLAEIKTQLGDIASAEGLCREALKSLSVSGASRELAQTKLRLAGLRRSLGDLAEAEQLLRQVMVLTSESVELEEERITAKRQLAALLPSTGRFRESLALNEQLLNEAAARGIAGDRWRIEALVNLAITHLHQGAVDAAQQRATDARALAESTSGKNSLLLATIFNLQAAVASSQGQDLLAMEHASAALRVCEQQSRMSHTEAATAHQWLGISKSRQRDLDAARQHWREAAKIFRSLGQSAREAHVLAMLGGIALRGSDDITANEAIQDALTLLAGHADSPLTRYVVSVHEALLHDRGGRRAEAIRTLQQAVDIAESSREQTASGAETGRARHFAKFAPAFEQLVAWNLEAGLLPDAFLAAEQSRSRTFLDHMQVAGVDLNSTLSPEDQSRWLPQERMVNEQLTQLRRQLRETVARSDQATSDLPTKAELTQQLTEAESRYAETWRAIRDASPVYSQSLVSRDSLCRLHDLRREVLPDDCVLLFYQLGQRSSWLWVITASEEPLIIPLDLKHALPALEFEPRPMAAVTRDLIGQLSVNKGLLKSGLDAVTPGPLTRDMASRLVTWYLAATVPFTTGGTRGLAGTVATVKGNAISPTSLNVVGETLLPAGVREFIRRRKPRSIVVVPDAALHELPFESLLLSAGPEVRYVLDDWPPISYCASATVLARLMRRTKSTSDSSRGLLLVGHSFSEGHEDASRPAVTSIPGALVECQQIKPLWPRTVTSLLTDEARKSRVLPQLERHAVLHFAAHGFVEEHADNLFGGLLLPAGPLRGGVTDEGALSYLDILRKDLTRCELAVLSACQTSVGPERPMEASTSLAQAFLMVGTNQVVASLWRVSDESTTRLMVELYQQLSSDVAAGRSLRVAEALHFAKRSVRAQAAWSSPAHWAAFVHIGPPGRLSGGTVLP